MTIVPIKNKPLKWTTQRVNTPKNTHRVHKRTPSASRAPLHKNKKIMAAMISPQDEIASLMKELTFTYDSWATLTVHLSSLRDAYESSKEELEQTKFATRLGEKEKELLIAYDDLGLQVNQLDRKLEKINKRIEQLKQTPQPTPSPTPMYSPVSSVSSVCSSHLDHSPTQQYDLPFLQHEQLTHDPFDIISMPYDCQYAPVSDIDDSLYYHMSQYYQCQPNMYNYHENPTIYNQSLLYRA